MQVLLCELIDHGSHALKSEMLVRCFWIHHVFSPLAVPLVISGHCDS